MVVSPRKKLQTGSSTATAATLSGPLSRRAWARAALSQMGKTGSLKVSVEALAQQLGVTKGSFYWHFKTRDELLAAALELWERVATDDLIERLAPIADPRERLRGLLAFIFDDPEDLAVEGVILAAADDPKLGRSVRRVSKRRLRYVIEAYRETGLSAAEAEHWGFLTYSAFVGALIVMRTTSGAVDSAELKRYARHLNRVLVP